MSQRKMEKNKNQKPPKKKIDPLSFDDVLGLGPTKIAALKKANITSSLQLCCKFPNFLKDATGMDIDQAGKAMQIMLKRLEKAGHISKMTRSATAVYEERKKIKRLSIGCRSLDRLFDGGIEPKAVTEIFGESGSGKTQLAHTLCVQAQRPVKDGGFLEPGEDPPIVLYINAEKTFRVERIHSILRGKKLVMDFPSVIKQKLIDGKELSPAEKLTYNTVVKKQESEYKKWTDRIEVQDAVNAYDLLFKVQNAMQTCNEMNVRLIIFDSGVVHVRSDYTGLGNMSPKFQLLNEMLGDLRRLADIYNLPVIFINQIYTSPTEDYGKDPIKNVGGNVVAHANPYRIKFEKFQKTRKATIVKSPYQANDTASFIVNEAGMSDIE